MERTSSFLLLALIACAGKTNAPAAATDGGLESDGATIGTPCVPADESSTTFTGAIVNEVSFPGGNGASGSPVCLVNHFQGRVSCPYGGTECKTPSGAAVTGDVKPQCLDRRASRVVTFSCRCGNAGGATNDGDAYCTCPSGAACTQLVSPLGPNDHTSGAYCIPEGTTYPPGAACAGTCDPALGNCN